MFKITDVRNKEVPVEKVVKLSTSRGWNDPILGDDLWYLGKYGNPEGVVNSNPTWELTAEQLLQLINRDEYSFNATEMFDLDLPKEKKTLITNVRSKLTGGKVMIVGKGWKDTALSDKQLYYVLEETYESVNKTRIVYNSDPVFLVDKEDIDYIKSEYDFNYVGGLVATKALITDVSMKGMPNYKVVLIENGWEQPELGKDKKFWYVVSDDITEDDRAKGIIDENPALEVNASDLQHLSEHFDFNIVDKNVNGNIEQPELEPSSDMVNHPSHYADTDLPVEVIDIIEPVVKNYPSEVGYHIGNVIKYLLRAPYKNNLKEDVSKAEFYLKRAKDILEDK